jgi:hypothetical protein
MLTNEARAIVNLPPVKGGDELVTPLNVLVGDNPRPAPAVMPPQNPNGPDQGGGERTGGADKPTQPASRTGTAPKSSSGYEDITSLTEVTIRDGEGEVVYPEKPVATSGLSPVEAQVKATIERLYLRQERSVRESGDFSVARFSRELASDLAKLAPGVDRAQLRAASYGINEAIETSLATGANPPGVFAVALDDAGHIAKTLVTWLGMDPKAMQALNVPDEIVWERAGFLPEQIDQMRTVQLAHEMGSDGPSAE